MAFVPIDGVCRVSSATIKTYPRRHHSTTICKLSTPSSFTANLLRQSQLRRARSWAHPCHCSEQNAPDTSRSIATSMSLLDDEDDVSEESLSSPGIETGSGSGVGSGPGVGSRVGSGAGVETYKFEDAATRVTRLQQALDEAVAAEEYGTAALLRDALNEATNEDLVLILSALVGYYDAFSAQNVDRIRHQWHDRQGVVCQHPLTSAQVGYQNIINGYRSLFSTLPSDFSVSMSDVRIATHGEVAYATCVELPHSASLQVDMRGDGTHKDGFGGGRHAQTKTKWHGLLATHILEKVWDYRRQQFKYLLVHHISSPIIKGGDPR